MALAETANLLVRIRAEDKVSPVIGKLEKRMGGLSQTAAKLGRGVQLGLTAVGAGLLGATVAGVKLAADWEAQLNTINTILRAETPEALQKVGMDIRALAVETGASLDDLSAAYYDILSAGIAGAGAIDVLTAANRLAVGGLSTTAEAVNVVTTALNAYNLTSADAGRVADVFAKSIEGGVVKASDIAASFANVAPTAAQMGIEFEEIAAAYATLTTQGTSAAEVTTQMNRALTDLIDPNKELLALQKKLGVSFLEMAKEKGLVYTLQEMRDAVGGNAQDLQKLFGRVEGYKFALQTTGPQQTRYNEQLKAMRNAAGTAAGQMSERQKGLVFQVNRLKAGLRDAGITIGQALIPGLADLVDKINKFLGDPNTQQLIKDFAKGLSTAFGQLAQFIQRVDFGAIAAGLNLLAAPMRAIVDAFLALPPGVQSMVVAGAAVSKLTGVGPLDLAKGLGSMIGGLRGASPMNPVFVADVTGGAGLPGKGGPGGLLGKLGLGGLISGGALTTVLAASSVAALGTAIAGTMFYLIPTLVNAGKPAREMPDYATNTALGTIPGETVNQFTALMPQFESMLQRSGATAVAEVVKPANNADRGTGADLGARGRNTGTAIETLRGYLATLNAAIKAEQAKPSPDAAKIAKYTEKLNLYADRLRTYNDRLTTRKPGEKAPDDTRSETAGVSQAVSALATAKLDVRDERARERLNALHDSTSRVRETVASTGSRSEAALARLDASTQRVRDAITNLPAAMSLLMGRQTPPVYVTVNTKATVTSNSVTRGETTTKRWAGSNRVGID